VTGRESARYFRKRHLEVRQFIAGAQVDRSQWPAVAASAASALPGLQPPPLPPPREASA